MPPKGPGHGFNKEDVRQKKDSSRRSDLRDSVQSHTLGASHGHTPGQTGSSVQGIPRPTQSAGHQNGYRPVQSSAPQQNPHRPTQFGTVQQNPYRPTQSGTSAQQSGFGHGHTPGAGHGFHSGHMPETGYGAHGNHMSGADQLPHGAQVVQHGDHVHVVGPAQPASVYGNQQRPTNSGSFFGSSQQRPNSQTIYTQQKPNGGGSLLGAVIQAAVAGMAMSSVKNAMEEAAERAETQAVRTEDEADGYFSEKTEEVTAAPKTDEKDYSLEEGYPSFCPGCGAPTTGKRFCEYCDIKVF